MIIRLCQFHVIQAIIRWDADRTDTASPPRLSVPIKRSMLVEFRELQRSNTDAEWNTKLEVFKVALTKLLGDAFPSVWNYFEKNWFNEFWRRKSICNPVVIDLTG